jgi:competence protein ComEA
VPPVAAPDPDSAELAAAGGASDSVPLVLPGSRAPAPPRRAPVDLNRAGARELDGLPGIGPVIAERIVLQRRRYGPFRGIDELLAVRGVGPRLLERIRPWATVGPPPGAALSVPVAGGLDSATRTSR